MSRIAGKLYTTTAPPKLEKTNPSIENSWLRLQAGIPARLHSASEKTIAYLLRKHNLAGKELNEEEMKQFSEMLKNHQQRLRKAAKLAKEAEEQKRKARELKRARKMKKRHEEMTRQ